MMMVADNNILTMTLAMLTWSWFLCFKVDITSNDLFFKKSINESSVIESFSLNYSSPMKYNSLIIARNAK